mmetsp:Transcript_28875/g.40842  ORF Transcript_28875/g.40842 Transcript_28875/m.40842 type:complete len:119 (+) Transcript_28875:161-517(+)
MSEYWLVNDTSALALSVAGVFKELLTILGAIFFFSDHVNQMNILGFALCQGGILTYVFLRVDNTQSYAPVVQQNQAVAPHQHQLRSQEGDVDKNSNKNRIHDEHSEDDNELNDENELI